MQLHACDEPAGREPAFDGFNRCFQLGGTVGKIEKYDPVFVTRQKLQAFFGTPE